MNETFYPEFGSEKGQQIITDSLRICTSCNILFNLWKKNKDFKESVKHIIKLAKIKYAITKEDNKLIYGNDYEIYNNKLDVLDWILKELNLKEDKNENERIYN